jgi:hypothetical protein
MSFYRFATRVLSVLACALILGALQPSQAQAVNITVSGTTYDVQFFPGGESFDDNQAAIEASPWWGSAALAQDFADAYAAQVPTPYPFNDTAGTDLLFFSFAVDPTWASIYRLDETGAVIPALVGRGVTLSFHHQAYVAALPVPEIDGGALGQGAVILLAVWLLLRRRGVMRA